MHISGATSVVGLIGFPARYSLSPAMHNAAYQDLGLDAVFAVFPVSPERLPLAIDGVRSLGLAGVAVTVPHKEAVLSFVDELASSAKTVGAVNWVSNNGGVLIGHNTDGAGFLSSLAAADVELGERTVAIFGGGGAARSIVGAVRAVAHQVFVHARNHEQAQALANEFGVVAVSAEEAMSADVVVNCTSAGMVGGGSETVSAVPVDLIRSDHIVVDIVYAPEVTPLLNAAEDRGARTVGGLGMLAGQAAEQIQILCGQRPSIEVMMAAARREQASK